MRTWSDTYKLLAIFYCAALVLLFASCQFTVRKYFGIPNELDLYPTNDEVIKYYSDFSKFGNTSIYAFADSLALVEFDRHIKKYPIVFVENTRNKNLLKLDCLEDLKLNVADINSNNINN